MMMFRTKRRKITFGRVVRAFVLSVFLFGLGYMVQYLFYNNLMLLLALIFVALFAYMLFFPRGMN